MKRYGILVSYAATPGFKSPTTHRWLLQPTDAHQAIVGWHDSLADAQATRNRLFDLVGTSNIDDIKVIEVLP